MPAVFEYVVGEFKMNQKNLVIIGIIIMLLLSPLYSSVRAAPSISTKDGTWPPIHEPVAFLPRVNVVHVSEGITDTEYNFLTAIPMSIFHYQGTVYQSLLTTDHTWDKPTGYIIDDWCTYLSDWGGATDINFIGDVPQNVTNALISQYGVGTDHVSFINGTPIAIANKIAAHDWKRSEYVVIIPYVSPVVSQDDIESISNGASLASLHNAPLLLSGPSSISTETLAEIAALHASKAILVDIGNSLSQSVHTQLTAAGVTIENDCTSEQSVVSLVRGLTGASTLCAILHNWQNLPASMSAACYGGYTLFLPMGLAQLTRETFNSLTAADFVQYKLLQSMELPKGYRDGEQAIALQFYNWLDTVGGNDTEQLETVITFNTQPYYDIMNGFDVTFDRAISGDPSRLTDPGAVTGRMPLFFIGNIALANRDSMYRATIFANKRPKHVTLAMNAYEVEHTINSGRDNWGLNHIVNEIFGWPFRGWCAENGYFPWQDIQDNMPDLSPVLPPGPGNGPDCDPGQFASFIASYETHFHSGAYAGQGSHPSQPDVPNCGFVSDLNNGSVFLYFSCHGGGTGIAVRHTDDGVAQDSDDRVPWEGHYWPSTDGIVYDGSEGGYYNQYMLDADVTNVQGAMTAYNACDMANGRMNEVLLLHGGAASFGSYTSVSFDGSGWWWNLFVHCVTHLNFTIGEAAAYATARVAKLYLPDTPPQPRADTSLQYVVYGDPMVLFIKENWSSPTPAATGVNYGGHVPDLIPNEPPNAPEKPSGRTQGKPGMTYLYTTRSTDPEGQQLWYEWDWGDGNMSAWIGPFSSGDNTTVTHTWTKQGTYLVRVKCHDTMNEESNWSEPLSVVMPAPALIPLMSFLYNLLQFLSQLPLMHRLFSGYRFFHFFS
jgi:hypothetical protein